MSIEAVSHGASTAIYPSGKQNCQQGEVKLGSKVSQSNTGKSPAHYEYAKPAKKVIRREW